MADELGEEEMRIDQHIHDSSLPGGLAVAIPDHSPEFKALKYVALFASCLMAPDL